MKRLLIITLVFMSSCMANDDKSLPGEHLNGLRYELYSGPADVQQSYLDRVVIALENYRKESSDDALKKALDQSHDKKWTRVDFEYLTPKTEGSPPLKIRIGVRYEKGELQCVVYENQVMVAFSVAAPERRLEKMYYMSGEKELRVTHTYTF